MNRAEQYRRDLIPEKLRDLKISNNRTYRFSDIINKKGPTWKETASKVMANKKTYKNTILFRYLKKNGVFGEKNTTLLRSIEIEKSIR